MTARRAGPAALALGILALAGIASGSLFEPSPAAAAAPIRARSGVVVVLVADRFSFEEVMRVPGFRQLARLGGAGLMATDQAYRDVAEDAYRALGSGAPPGEAPDQLLGRTLAEAGVSVCVEETTGVRPGPGDPARFLGAGPSGDCSGVSATPSTLQVAVGPATFGIDQRTGPPRPGDLDPRRRLALLRLSEALRRLIGGIPASTPWMAVVVTPSPSGDMREAGDEVTPIVLATGRGRVALGTNGPIPGLTSDTTRQDGLVANVDLAPTILAFFGLPIPDQMDGQPIHPAGTAPYGLHRLHLEARRTRLGVQFALLGFVFLVGLWSVGALLVLGRRGRVSAAGAVAVRFALLCAASLLLALLAGGWLPRRTYAWEFGMLILAVPGLALLSLAWARRGPFGPFTLLGGIALVFIVLDALLGWHAMRTPLFGGTMFDGVRFYGLPNAFTALLLASAVYVALPLDPLPGFLVLVGAGLFAGFPSLGADVGGAITLFAAAGIWWVVRTRPRIGAREVAFAVGVVLIGLGGVLVANRVLPGSPTHATRFVSRAGSSLSGAFDEVRHRLAVGARQVGAQPGSLIPLLGLPIVLWVIAARPRPVGEAMTLDERWRLATVTIIVAAMLAFVANDTGAAAAGPAFIYAVAGITYPAMLLARRTPP